MTISARRTLIARVSEQKFSDHTKCLGLEPTTLGTVGTVGSGVATSKPLSPLCSRSMVISSLYIIQALPSLRSHGDM